MSGEWQTLLDLRGVGVERRRDAGRLTAAVVGGLLALATTGCVGTADDDVRLSPTTMRVGNTDVYTYQLVCPSPVGNLSTSIEFSVTDSLEDVSTGDTVTYTITAPLAQVQTPVTPTFESSTTTYRIPKGLDVTSATMDPTKNSDFTSTSTNVTDTEVSFTLKGDFPLDGTPRTTPVLEVEATITAASGQDIVWLTPTSIDGAASVPVLGSQTSNCSFPENGPIGTTNVL